MKNILIIGGGVIGLSLAYEISQKKKFKVILFEKNKNLGLGATNQNSEVIHSGVYYKNNSLKAKLCVEGKVLIYKFCKKYKILFKKTQKLFIGNSSKDFKLIKRMHKNAKKNNVKDVKIIKQNKIMKLEPSIKAKYALLSKSSGIFDVKSFLKKLYYLCRKNNVKFVFNTKISKGFFKKNKFMFKNTKHHQYDLVINAAGVGAIKIANSTFKTANFPIDKPVWGMYFKTKQDLRVNRIIYPAMSPGENMERVDISPIISGGYLLGPSVEKKAKINVDDVKLKFVKFLGQIHSNIDIKKIRFLKKGLRPKIETFSKSYTDFYIKKVKHYNWINLFGIESPGLTSCFSIAKYIVRKYL